MSDDTGSAPIDWHAAAARQHRHNMQLPLTTVGDTDILDDKERSVLFSVAFNGGTRGLASIMHKLQSPGRQSTAALAARLRTCCRSTRSASPGPADPVSAAAKLPHPG
jgi:hypothetical protein